MIQPKFKIGDKVILIDFPENKGDLILNMQGIVQSFDYYNNEWIYYVNFIGYYINDTCVYERRLKKYNEQLTLFEL